MLTCVFVICSIRTNICFFSALLLIVVTFGLIAGTHFQLALGHAALAAKLLVVRVHLSTPPFLYNRFSY